MKHRDNANDLVTPQQSEGGTMIARRELFLVLGAAAFSPFASFGQQKRKIWRVGFLTYRDPDNISGSFRHGMRELGYVERHNLVIEGRSADARIERLPELAAELVRLKVDVLVTQGTPAAQAAQQATRAIPIVMSGVGDPVGTGLVKSLARPGGNSTALTVVTTDLSPKLLGLLLEVTKTTRVAMLLNPGNDSNRLMLKNLQAAAQELGVDDTARRSAYAAGDCERVCRHRTPERRRSVRGAGRVSSRTQGGDCRARHAAAAAIHQHIAPLCGGRCLDELRSRVQRKPAARRHLRRQDPERRETRRHPGRATDEVRIVHQ
jgi:hypothetical protein